MYCDWKRGESGGDVDNARGLAFDNGQTGLNLYVDRLYVQGLGYNLLVAYGKDNNSQKEHVEQHDQQDKTPSRAECETPAFPGISRLR